MRSAHVDGRNVKVVVYVAQLLFTRPLGSTHDVYGAQRSVSEKAKNKNSNIRIILLDHQTRTRTAQTHAQCSFRRGHYTWKKQRVFSSVAELWARRREALAAAGKQEE